MDVLDVVVVVVVLFGSFGMFGVCGHKLIHISAAYDVFSETYTGIR